MPYLGTAKHGVVWLKGRSSEGAEDSEWCNLDGFGCPALEMACHR